MPDHSATPFELFALACVGLIAGWINAVAGAGSLLLLPTLIFTGLPADAANATNRIGVVATTAAALWGFRQSDLRPSRDELHLALISMVGAGLGAWLATLMAANQIRLAIIIAMGVMLVVSLLPRRNATRAATAPTTTDAANTTKNDRGGAEEPEQVRNAGAAEPARPAANVAERPLGLLKIVAFGIIGVYGGFLQAGVGVLILLYLSSVHGISMVRSNVTKSVVILGLSLISIGIFVWRGVNLDWIRGLVLALSNGVGAVWGARASVARGDGFVRLMVVVAVVGSMIRLLIGG